MRYGITRAEEDVLAERQRQIDVEGYTPECDDGAGEFDLAIAGACYVMGADGKTCTSVNPPIFWPWSRQSWKPKNPRRDLVRAAALILAEIERIDRAALKTPNAKSQATDAALSRQVACTDGLGVAVPPAPTLGE